MKRLAMTFALAATLVGQTAFADAPANPSTTTGKGAAASRQAASTGFAWGVGIGALVVLGVIVGVVAGNSGSSFSH